MYLLFGIISIPANSQDYSISLLPFNTDQYSEYAPVYYRGDIVFCSDRKNTMFIDYRDERRNLPATDIFVVEDVGRNEWGKPELLSKKFRSNFYEGPAAFNSRGSEIYFTRNTNVKKKIGNAIDKDNKLGIYISKYSRREDGWSTQTQFKYNNPDYNYAHPSLCVDERCLYFVSEMAGGYGG